MTAEVRTPTPPTPDADEADLTQLRGGAWTADPRLGRIPEFHERSRSFPMAAVLDDTASLKPRSYTWNTTEHFNQGSEGSCVGHAWGHEAVARPMVIPNIDQPFCLWIYKTSQRYDAWSGEAYEGTSTIAGAKVLQSRPPAMNEGRGLMDEYRWIFGDLDELTRTLGYHGPVVAGLNWYQGMMDAGSDGYIRRTGSFVGGHAILIKGVNLTRRAYRMHNSWGTGWGEGGDAWLSFDDMETLLHEDGELCVPVRRKQWG